MVRMYEATAQKTVTFQCEKCGATLNVTLTATALPLFPLWGATPEEARQRAEAKLERKLRDPRRHAPTQTCPRCGTVQAWMADNDRRFYGKATMVCALIVLCGLGVLTYSLLFHDTGGLIFGGIVTGTAALFTVVMLVALKRPAADGPTLTATGCKAGSRRKGG